MVAILSDYFPQENRLKINLSPKKTSHHTFFTARKDKFVTWNSLWEQPCHRDTCHTTPITLRVVFKGKLSLL